MGETYQKEMMKELRTIKSDVEYIKEFLEDTRLTPEERTFVDSRIKKITSGDTSDFVSWKDAKEKLGQ
jgi:hypothetical protein